MEGSGDEEAIEESGENGKELVKFKETDESEKFLASIIKQGAKGKLLPKKKCLKVFVEFKNYLKQCRTITIALIVCFKLARKSS